MNVKGTLVRTRLEFLAERFGPEAAARVLSTLSGQDRDVLRSALATSWVAFAVLNRFDEAVVLELGHGDPDLARELGAFTAQRVLATTYRVFVEQAHGDPKRLLERLADLHASLYDWGSTRVATVEAGRSRIERDYAGAASRTHCLAQIGFYAEALRQLDVTRAQVQERACQATGAPRCLSEVVWETRATSA